MISLLPRLCVDYGVINIDETFREFGNDLTAAAFMALIPGTNLGRYKLSERIGAGGMGEVCLAHDPHLDRRIAIKVLPDHLAGDSVARERLRREALAAAALDHPFICKVFEVGEESGNVFIAYLQLRRDIAMEYVRGETLLTRTRSGRLPLSEALRIAGEMAEAISI